MHVPNYISIFKYKSRLSCKVRTIGRYNKWNQNFVTIKILAYVSAHCLNIRTSSLTSLEPLQVPEKDSGCVTHRFEMWLSVQAAPELCMRKWFLSLSTHDVALLSLSARREHSRQSSPRDVIHCCAVHELIKFKFAVLISDFRWKLQSQAARTVWHHH